MGLFIKAIVDRSRCLGVSKSGHCIQICPVNIFEAEADQVVINEENEDECTLCDLCLQKCEPNAITIKKLYE
jgi:NAD-dependent dihydropyrimidine dehydrogenase PreA subunit